jgi:micrococcal nuclease
MTRQTDRCGVAGSWRPVISPLLFAILLSGVTAYDGDTYRASGISYRLARVDPPEIGRERPRCWAELAMRLRARGHVRTLLAGASRVEAIPDFDNPGRTSVDADGWPLDRYRRRIAHIRIDGRDLGRLLIRDGHGVVWNPDQPHDWCRV